MFVALKTDGDIRHRARDLAVRIGAVAAVLAVVFLVWTQSKTGTAVSAVLFVVAALALVGGLLAAMRGREGWAFVGTFVTIGLAVAGLFVALFPDVMPSTTDPGLLAHHHQRRVDAVHAQGDDVGRGRLHPDRPRLPGVDLLGVPQADRGAPHPDGRAGRGRRRREAARPGGPPPPPPGPRAAVAGRARAGSSVGWPTVAQAFALGALVVAAVTPPAGGWTGAAWAFAGLVLLRTGAAYVGQRAAARAAGEVSGALRQRLLDAARRSDDLSPARLVVLATRGVAGVEPYVTRYLPALVPAVVLPLVALAAIAWLDPLSGLVVAADAARSSLSSRCWSG